MTLRIFLALLVALSLALGIASVVASYWFIENQVLALFPATESAAVAQTLHMLLFEQAVASILLSIVIGLFAFWVIGTLVAKPLRRLVYSMQAYADKGEYVEIPTFKFVPLEIKQLSVSFSSFLEKVDASHKRDVEISRVKSDFISTAAHQLRTPLTGIRWALEALEKESLTESQKALIASAKDKSHDLVAIVGTLLDISSIESGKYKYAFVPVNLRSMLQEVAQGFGQMAEQRNVSVFFVDSQDTIPPVKADKERLKWVLNNLVENAIQYTPNGGTVKLMITAAPGRVYVQVKDTGIGISTEDQGNIFERFYRAGNAIAKENKGNGLGLYIARTIANDHGGDLNFSANQDGPGTTFTLSLPINA